MKCTKSRRMIERALEGELAVDRRWMLDEHLEACSACRDYAAKLGRLERALEEADEPLVTPAELELAVASIRERIDDAQPGEGAVVLAGPGSRSRWLVAAGLLVTAGAALLARQFLDSDRDPMPEDTTSVAQGLPEPSDASPAVDHEATNDVEVATSNSTEVAPADVWTTLESGASFADEALLQELGRGRSKRMLLREVEGALFSDSVAVARQAARVLGLHGERSSLFVLERALDASDDEQLCRSLCDALIRFGDRGERVLTRALAGEDKVRAAALSSLMGTESDSVLQTLDQDWQANLRRGRDDRARHSLELLLSSAAGARALASIDRFEGRRANEVIVGALSTSLAAVANFEDYLDEHETLGPHLWGFLELTETERTGDWLTERVASRASRARALEALTAWSGEGALPVWIALERERSLSSSMLIEPFGALLRRDVEGADRATATIVQRAVNGGRDEREMLPVLAELLVLIDDPNAAVLMRRLLWAGEFLPEGETRWLALAIAEVGDERMGPRLVEDLASGLELDRFARAATWIAAARCSGPAVLDPLTNQLGPAGRSELERAFRSPNTVGTSRIARLLDRHLDPDSLSLIP